MYTTYSSNSTFVGYLIPKSSLDFYFITLGVQQGDLKYYFWIFGMTRPGIEHWSLGPLMNHLRNHNWKDKGVMPFQIVFVRKWM